MQRCTIGFPDKLNRFTHRRCSNCIVLSDICHKSYDIESENQITFEIRSDGRNKREKKKHTHHSKTNTFLATLKI